MRLITFLSPTDGRERLGALSDGTVVDLAASDPALPDALVPFLEGGPETLDRAKAVLRRGGPSHPEGAVRWLAPVPRPGALRDFFAFEDHALQGAARRKEPLAAEWYDQPVYYKGNHREVYGPGDVVPWPSYTRRLDFEHEIACVVAKKGRDLSPEQAASHIGGYMIFNDFSARDIQKNEMICRMGPAKAKDFANAFGPWLLTADELPEPEGLKMTAYVNGEKWGSGDSSGRYWSFPLMLSHVSQGETVYPGDILGSGTYYRGCGLDLDRWIQPGDVVALEVERLGRLENKIGAPTAQRQLKYPRREAHGARR